MKGLRLVGVVVVILTVFAGAWAQNPPNPPAPAVPPVGEIVLYVVPGSLEVRPAIVVREVGTPVINLHVFYDSGDLSGWPTAPVNTVSHHDARYMPGGPQGGTWHWRTVHLAQ